MASKKRFLLGVDVGTTGTKILAIDPQGRPVAGRTEEYPLLHPKPSWAEQNPEGYWKAFCRGVKRVLREGRILPSQIQGIGLSGQMHSAIFLGKKGEVLRPAILWCDQRTEEECVEMERILGRSNLMRWALNPALTGFTAPKILWVRNHEPSVMERTRHILLPKDYIRYLLSGEFLSEVSDASGTLLLDVKKRRWSDSILRGLSIPKEWLPEVRESPGLCGVITQTAARKTGLKPGTPIVGGGGDCAAGGIGAGIVHPGLLNVSIGTSGVVFSFTPKPVCDPRGRLHSFCHCVPGKWHVMGVMLMAGGSLRYIRDTLCREEIEEAKKRSRDPYDILTAKAKKAEPGSGGLLFLPYLAGERTPHADPKVRGAFVGLGLGHRKAHWLRAVLEGICFGLRDSLEIFKTLGISIEEIRVTGGGARSAVWRQILADILDFPVTRVKTEEGPSMGAALLAGVGTGVFPSVEEACKKTVLTGKPSLPRRKFRGLYQEQFDRFKSAYPALRPLFHSNKDSNEKKY